MTNLGPYEIRGELGRGAMAVVWRAWDPRLEREVAIKEPTMAAGGDPGRLAELAERFVREGKAAAQLNHPGIVTIFSSDIYDGRPAIVMELIEGETLAAVLERGALDPASVAAVLDQLLDAVGYAHGRGVVHRDIKPDNVFITHLGRVKLADFGIAHLGTTATLTQAGTIMGTPGYMAPEQVTGMPADARADIFAIGAIGHEMLTGRNPFGATDGDPPTAVMYRIVHEAPQPLPPSVDAGLPGPLAGSIQAALAKDPSQRFQSADAFRAALSGRTASVPVPMLASSLSPTAAVSPQRATWLPWMVAAAIATVAIALFVWNPGASSGGGGGGGGTGGGTGTGSADGAPPSVSIVTPVAEGEVASPFTLRAEADDDVGVAEVVFFANGEQVGSSMSPPYECSLSLGPGDYELKARARDTVGNTGDSGSLRVSVAAASVPAPAELDPPEQTVINYYAACDKGACSTAYNYFSSDYKATHPYARYRDKVFKYMGGARVQHTSSEVNGARATVSVRVEVKGKGMSSWQKWSGTMTLVKEGGRWLIHTMKLTQ